MPLSNSTVVKGQYAEYAVWKKLESLGFRYIVRSYASHGPIDLLCANDTGELWAVQVKSSKHGSYLSPKELERLFEWSRKFNAKPIFAFKKKGRWIFKPLLSESEILKFQKALSESKEDEDNVSKALLQEILEANADEM